MPTLTLTLPTAIEIPEVPGYEVARVGGFPDVGEPYILANDEGKFLGAYDSPDGKGNLIPRIKQIGGLHYFPASHYVVLRKKVVYVTEVTFTPTGEKRKPKEGEWFLLNNDPEYTSYAQQGNYNDYCYTYEIVKRTTRQVAI